MEEKGNKGMVKFNKIIITIGIIIFLFLIGITVIVNYKFNIHKNNNTIVGTWYSLEVYGFQETFVFKDDGKAKYNMIDLDSYEDLNENKGLGSEVADFKYTLDGKKGELLGKNEKFDMEYIVDGENTRIVLTYKDEGSKRTYYKSIDKARQVSDFYTETLEYILNYSDKNGWAIKDGELLGYIGDKKEVKVPEKVKNIKTSAFSADYNRGTKLKKVVVPGNVKRIEAGAFAFTCAKEIVIEEGVKEIEDNCFADSYLKEIHFPKSVEKIGNGIMDTEEGLNECVIYCVKDSAMDKYLKKNKPYGTFKIKY